MERDYFNDSYEEYDDYNSGNFDDSYDEGYEERYEWTEEDSWDALTDGM